MAVSAVVTGGIGPWLPFQMLGARVDGRAAPGAIGPIAARLGLRGRSRRARGVRLGLGVRLRGDHEPVVLAVPPGRRPARSGARPRRRARRCSTTGRSTSRRHSRGTPPARSPTRCSSCSPAPRSCRSLRRFAHRLDPVVELVSIRCVSDRRQSALRMYAHERRRPGRQRRTALADQAAKRRE